MTMSDPMMGVYAETVATLSPATLHRFILTLSTFTKITGRVCMQETSPYWEIGRDIYGAEKSAQLMISDRALVVVFDGDECKPGATQKKYDEIRAYCALHGIKIRDEGEG